MNGTELSPLLLVVIIAAFCAVAGLIVWTVQAYTRPWWHQCPHCLRWQSELGEYRLTCPDPDRQHPLPQTCDQCRRDLEDDAARFLRREQTLTTATP